MRRHAHTHTQTDAPGAVRDVAVLAPAVCRSELARREQSRTGPLSDGGNDLARFRLGRVHLPPFGELAPCLPPFRPAWLRRPPSLPDKSVALRHLEAGKVRTSCVTRPLQRYAVHQHHHRPHRRRRWHAGERTGGPRASAGRARVGRRGRPRGRWRTVVSRALLVGFVAAWLFGRPASQAPWLAGKGGSGGSAPS